MKHLDISPEILGALSEGRPVVALESTIISHGMPYPRNLECASMCEEVIRAHGACPATVAIIGGRMKAGLSQAELEHLATSGEVVKCSRRDIAAAVSSGADGAATVSATMIIAAMAGIKFFATGGIGGVHRGGQDSMDISADLRELAMTEVCVVSAGVKSILDIGRTLEYLETLGVPVISYGQDEFPAFYTRTSGFKAPLRIDSPGEIAAMLRAKWELGLSGGVLVGNPVPEEYAMPRGEIDTAIETALRSADKKGIQGKEITPYLLDAIKTITDGRSLETNMRLVYSNAELAARIAVGYYGV